MRNEVELEVRQGDGNRLRDHLRVVERASGRRVERLHRECPPGARHVWGWFMQLTRSRMWVNGSPIGLSALEVEAWCRLSGATMTRHEYAMLCAIDQTYLEVINGG